MNCPRCYTNTGRCERTLAKGQRVYACRKCLRKFVTIETHMDSYHAQALALFAAVEGELIGRKVAAARLILKEKGYLQ